MSGNEGSHIFTCLTIICTIMAVAAWEHSIHIPFLCIDISRSNKPGSPVFDCLTCSLNHFSGHVSNVAVPGRN